ncbi:MAG: hypothetical protein K2Q29_10130 [Sphingomonadales bacterium]|nr:hypothetical protein [Sphingomonadales bacterium]
MGQLTDEQRAVAEADAQRWWDSANDRLRFSVEYAQAGIKSLFIANGGGILALLTFAGDADKIAEPRALFWSFVWFGLGCACALFVYIAGYLSQSHVMQSEYLRSRQATADALGVAREYDPSETDRLSEVAERTGMICAIVSLSLFVLGALVGLDAIT